MNPYIKDILGCQCHLLSIHCNSYGLPRSVISGTSMMKAMIHRYNYNYMTRTHKGYSVCNVSILVISSRLLHGNNSNNTNKTRYITVYQSDICS